MPDVSQIMADIEAWLDKATPGEWRAEGSIYERMGAEVVATRGLAQLWESPRCFADAAYIVACSPDRIRALLDEVKRLQWDLDVETQAGHPVRVRLEAAEAELARLREPAGDVGEVTEAGLVPAGCVQYSRYSESVDATMAMRNKLKAAEALLREAGEVLEDIDAIARTTAGPGFEAIHRYARAFLGKLSPAPEPVREDTYPDRVSMATCVRIKERSS